MDDPYLWWRDGVIYQIYPRSFSDSNNDGLGDLPGITSRLGYLSHLGVDAIWLSPFYPSPDIDFGYDVSDHCAVDPRFGTLADFDELIREAHQRKIRVVLDLVLNHTSDQHNWFTESRSSRENPKRDWYIWQPPSASPRFLKKLIGMREAPNNWQSAFGGGGWEYDEKTGEYYFHMFVKEQPDLNWRNPQLRQAQLDVVRFWLARGADGFRLDVFNAYFKDEALRNNPPKFGLRGFDRQKHIYDIDQPEMMPLLAELRAILDASPEKYAVGETFLASPERAASYCGPAKLHAAFNFDFTLRPYRPSAFREAIQNWDGFAGQQVWPNYVLSNHDQPRAATRYARGEDDRRAQVVMALLLTLRGTPFLYYGEEIGLRDISLARHEILDPPGKYYWPFFKGRDGCRAPMQWDASPNAGFSQAKPWLKVHPNYTWRNAEAQQADPNSLFNFTRRLIGLRREHPALRAGRLDFLNAPGGVLAYTRSHPSEKLTVVLDFNGQNQDFRPGGGQLFASPDNQVRIYTCPD
ncbi:MAG: alpha-glucosidase [Anaerolineales bacterium]|jgi:alpha-glucosidase|nr:alpha-glucosidase [Anaerolineales bacterium]